MTPIEVHHSDGFQKWLSEVGFPVRGNAHAAERRQVKFFSAPKKRHLATSGVIKGGKSSKLEMGKIMDNSRATFDTTWTWLLNVFLCRQVRV